MFARSTACRVGRSLMGRGVRAAYTRVTNASRWRGTPGLSWSQYGSRGFCTAQSDLVNTYGLHDLPEGKGSAIMLMFTQRGLAMLAPVGVPADDLTLTFPQCTVDVGGKEWRGQLAEHCRELGAEVNETRVGLFSMVEAGEFDNASPAVVGEYGEVVAVNGTELGDGRGVVDFNMYKAFIDPDSVPFYTRWFLPDQIDTVLDGNFVMVGVRDMHVPMHSEMEANLLSFYFHRADIPQQVRRNAASNFVFASVLMAGIIAFVAYTGYDKWLDTIKGEVYYGTQEDDEDWYEIYQEVQQRRKTPQDREWMNRRRLR